MSKDPAESECETMNEEFGDVHWHPVSNVNQPVKVRSNER